MPVVMIGGHQVSLSNIMKYLGVTLDRSFTFGATSRRFQNERSRL